MNNYANMNYYMPDDFAYLNNLQNVPMQNQNIQTQTMTNGMNQTMINQNMINNQKLAKKLSMQAGDNMNFNISNYKQNPNKNNMYDVYNGFIRGNMFPDLYNTYKISKPFDIKPMNEQAELLTYIDAYCFAAHELNLYLDNNPNDRDMIRLFNEYTNEANTAISEYEQKYGPLFVDGSKTYPWAWNESPWPWENN